MCMEAKSLPAFEDTTTSVTAYTTSDQVQVIETTLLNLIAEHVTCAALIAIQLHFDSSSSKLDSYTIQRSSHYYLQHLRSLVRKTDQVFLVQQTAYFLLNNANQQAAEIVRERLWEALLWRVHNAQDAGMQQPVKMSIGWSAYPMPCRAIARCITTALVPRIRFEFTPEPTSYQPAQSPEEDLSVRARSIGIPYLTLLPRNLPNKVKRLVKPQLAQELCCYPLGRERNTLTVAMSDPCDDKALDRLQRETGLCIFPVLAHPQELQTALENLV